jgi:hypothetical protein
VVYSFQSPEAIARDIDQMRPAAATRDDGATRAGRADPGVGRVADPHLGTTGPPIRQAIDEAVLQRTVFSVTGGLFASPEDPPELSYWPFGGIGVCQLIDPATRDEFEQHFGIPI